MMTPLVTGLFALAGVMLGVTLEPVKAKVAARVRLREMRLDRCAQVVEAAMLSRATVLRLNRLHRRRHGLEHVTQQVIDTAEEEFLEARTELRRAVMLLHLSGPTELVEHAMRIRSADYLLRELRLDEGGDQDTDLNRPSGKVLRAADELDEIVLEFTRIARRNLV